MGVVGLLAVGLLALMAVVFALGSLLGWGSSALDKVTVAAAAVVAQTREEATRELEKAKGEVAAAVATAAVSSEEAARALDEAKTTIAGAREALVEPEAALNRATEAVAMEVERTAAAAAAAALPVLSERVDAAGRALEPIAGPDPTAWPQGLALRQIHYRKGERATEYAYVATEGFDLAQLRARLLAQGYSEHVIAEADGALEAVYRGERQLVLSVSTRNGHQHLDVREMALAVPPKADQ
jgi:hypothetical protein